MKIALLGYGKMGKAIEALALNVGHEVVLKLGRENLGDLTVEKLQQAEVAIEFSRPDSAFGNIMFCLETGIPVVSGTTGWLKRLPEAKSYCEKHQGALMYASNFSVGVNLFFAINRQLAEMMNQQVDYDIEIEEIHHTQKLDAPSGTAISLVEDIIERVVRKDSWVNETAAYDNEISILSKRIEKVPGTHEITYNSAIDSIVIRHTAHSRKGFAKGALMAAEWIIGKHGYFEMKDMLGF